MPFDPEQAHAISEAFRSRVTNDFDSTQRLEFERLLQTTFGIKNLRNVQLWTRPGTQTRDFINSRLGQKELETRLFLADRLLVTQTPPFPTKERGFELSGDNKNAQKFNQYLQDNYIREYGTNLFVSGNRIFIRYAADSDNPNEVPDFDSPEFDDLVA